MTARRLRTWHPIGALKPPPCRQRRPAPGNFFEDFRLGRRLVHPTPRTITDGRLRALHRAHRRARAGALRRAGRAGDGLSRPHRGRPAVFNVAFGKTVPDISLNAVANLGYADLRFLAPCYPGDTIRAESEVIGLRENSNGRSGVVYVRSNAYNQQGDAGADLGALGDGAQARARTRRRPRPLVPPSPSSCCPRALAVPAFLERCARSTSAITGGADLWDDYAPGERIDHPVGHDARGGRPYDSRPGSTRTRRASTSTRWR